jgi:glycerophosphoryl diester phosphodiesterase
MAVQTIECSVAPEVIAHRGNAREFPENTLAALRSAIEIGARFVQFDVQLTADAVPVLLHDDNLRRTGGRSDSVFDLQAMDLSFMEVMERERFDNRFDDICVPTLERAIELLASYPHVKAFVEIKRESLRFFGYELVLRNVLERLQPLRQQCIVISYDLNAIHRARRDSGIPIGWLLERYDLNSQLKFEALVPGYLFCDRHKFPPGASRLRRGPWHWAAYEIDSAEQAIALASRGVEFAVTMAVGPVLRRLRELRVRKA